MGNYASKDRSLNYALYIFQFSSSPACPAYCYKTHDRLTRHSVEWGLLADKRNIQDIAVRVSLLKILGSSLIGKTRLDVSQSYIGATIDLAGPP